MSEKTRPDWWIAAAVLAYFGVLLSYMQAAVVSAIAVSGGLGTFYDWVLICGAALSGSLLGVGVMKLLQGIPEDA